MPTQQRRDSDLNARTVAAALRSEAEFIPTIDLFYVDSVSGSAAILARTAPGMFPKSSDASMMEGLSPIYADRLSTKLNDAAKVYLVGHIQSHARTIAQALRSEADMLVRARGANEEDCKMIGRSCMYLRRLADSFDPRPNMTTNQLPDSCYFDAVHPLYATVRTDLIAAGFTNIATIGSGSYVSEIWIDIYPEHNRVKVSPAHLPREDYDYYSIDTAVVATLSG